MPPLWLLLLSLFVAVPVAAEIENLNVPDPILLPCDCTCTYTSSGAVVLTAFPPRITLPPVDPPPVDPPGPLPVGIHGEMVEGTTFTITGSGFGTRPDFHPELTKLIRVFDTFEDSDILDMPYGRWNAHNLGGGGVTLAREIGNQFYRRLPVNLGFLSIPGTDQKEYYSSNLIRFNSTGYSVSTGQHKTIRLYSKGENSVNVYPAHGASDGWHFMLEYIKPDVLRHNAQLTGIPDKPVGWHRLEIYYKKATSVAADDGEAWIKWDNVTVFDFRGRYDCGFDSSSADLSGSWCIGNYWSSAKAGSYADYDNVALDHSLARVEIADSDDYAKATVTEYIPVNTWTDTEIEATLYRGRFKSGDKVWVYVFDSRNNIISEDFSVTLK